MAALAFAGAAGCGNDEAGDQTVAAPSSSSGETAASGEETTSTTEQETGSETPETSGSGDAVEIVEFVFEPEELTVPVGTTVTFTNQDKAPHTATADDSSFDTEELGQGDSAEQTFDEPGTFTYYCRFHVFMKGSVVVE
jgi:plastocyanin